MEDPVQLVQEWFDWWRDDEDAPLALPGSLHVRTAIYLDMRLRQAMKKGGDL